MKPKKIKNKQTGFVVVVVLCMVIMLGAMLLVFNHQTRANLRTVDDFRKSEQAINCARAGLNIAISALRSTENIYINKKLMNLFSEENMFDIDDGTCFVAVVEENGKFNINLLKDKTGKLNQSRIEQLLRLIDILNRENYGLSHISYSFVPSIIDWTDTDNEATYLPFIKYENYGAESAYYGKLKPAYGCKNATFEVTEELLYVKDVTPEVYKYMLDYITVYGDGKININCAPKYVIQSLSEKLDSALTQLIVERRKIKPFDNITELRNIPGMTDDIYNSIKNASAINPKERYYRVVSRGNFAHLNSEIVAILKRNMETSNIEVILYNEI